MPLFTTFWKAYPLKRDKRAAEPAWNRLSAADKRAAIAGIEAYRNECLRTGANMMYPQGYLNHHRWEDEIEPAPTPEPDKKPARPESQAEPDEW